MEHRCRPGDDDGASMRLRQASGGWQTAGRAVRSGMKRRSTPVTIRRQPPFRKRI